MATATNKITVRIIADHTPENPRTSDVLGMMVCAPGRHNLGDDNAKQYALEIIYKHLSEKTLEMMHFDPDYLPDVERALQKTEQVILLPLYLYDHGGITMRTTPFRCPWDSGKVGFIFISKAAARTEFGWKRLTAGRITTLQTYLEGEVETYDQYLTGDVWGYEVVHDGEVVESCWGFFGHDPIQNGIVDHLSDGAAEVIRLGKFEHTYQ
ncbi:conserved hypothetical protein [Pseudomonas sp. 8Z]|uniref:hypothetical protein n=1 Tax=Pseudomonas sp. 8Z TaxID=2653166 RepID=UPI0012EF38CC|nr:hypothetical protein [Pseudomonas sp. 8Z]VXC23850.1 conserved hypothetical protein [Pseudomonas sp. 8Z]